MDRVAERADGAMTEVLPSALSADGLAGKERVRTSAPETGFAGRFLTVDCLLVCPRGGGGQVQHDAESMHTTETGVL